VTPRQLEEVRNELRRRRAAILQATRRADDELDALRASERGQELEEEAQAEQGAADLERLGQAERLELQRIDAALARLEAGTYGTCAECGAPIGAKRLGALPWAVRCADCAAAQEAAAGR
jgi:RNA polymerase-binding protein DksA